MDTVGEIVGDADGYEVVGDRVGDLVGANEGKDVVGLNVSRGSRRYLTWCTCDRR